MTWAAGAPGRGAGVLHPAASARPQAIIAARRRARSGQAKRGSWKDSGMWVIYLEAGVAVAMVLLIVWWTMRGHK